MSLCRDSLYQKDQVVRVDSIAIKQKFSASKAEVIPLSQREEMAYNDIDSTLTLDKAFKPSGFLAKFVNSDDDSNRDKKGESKNFLSTFSPSPQLWYNRVDGAHLGLSLSASALKNVLELRGNGGYKFALKKWAYGAGLRLNLVKRQRAYLDAYYQVGTDSRYESDNYSLFSNGLRTIFGYDDYFDYYRNERFRAKLGFRARRIDTRFALGFNNETHSSLGKSTDYALLRDDRIQRMNPPISAGTLRSATLSIAVGDDYVPYGIVGQNRASLAIEHSNPDLIASDFSFTRFHFTFDGRLDTFFKRRMLSNALDVRIVAGASRGELPVQRFGILESSSGILKPFGTFKTLVGTPYEGEKYFALFWEHNFRTVPFEILGLRALARKGIGVILHGASGRTWIADETLRGLSYFSPPYE